ncbi:hypothetical protein PAMA_013556 [Pampus argenteus]
MEYHSGGSLPLLGRPRYCPGANANGGYLCETGHCCGETGCCTYYYELWWFWLLWTVLILFSCCCAYRHRRAKLRVQQQQRQREISLLAYHGANSYPSSMLDLSFLASLKLPSYEEVAAQPSTPPPPYSSVFTTPRYPQPPRAADPHLLTQHGPLLHRPLSDGPSSLSSDNSSSLSAPVTYETDTSHASTPSEATPLTLDVTMETIAAAATCLGVNETRFPSATVAISIGDADDAGVQEPGAADSLVPNQTVTVAVVTRAASPQPLPSPGSELVLPVVAIAPIKQQLDLVPCSPIVSTCSSSTLPNLTIVNTVLPSIQIVSTEASSEGSTSGPSTPTTSTSSSLTATQTLTLNIKRTFDTDNIPSSPTSVPDDGRTLVLITGSAGASHVPLPIPSNPKPTLVPDFAPNPILNPKTAHLNPTLPTGTEPKSPTLDPCQNPELSPGSGVALVPPSPRPGMPQYPEAVAVLVSASSGPPLVLSQCPESDLISQVLSEDQDAFSSGSGSRTCPGVGSRSGPLSSSAPTHAFSSPPSSCPAITIESACSFTPSQSPPAVLSPSSQRSLPSPPPLTSPPAQTSTSLPAPALLLDPLTALHQSEKGGSSSGHASSLSPSPRATQSPPKQTLFSPCVDIFEPGPPSWEEGEEEQEAEDNDDDEEEDMEADESQYRHRRLTGDSGIEVCRCRVEEEDEEDEEEEVEGKEDDRRGGVVERDKKGCRDTDLHDSVDCPARGQITTGDGLTLCNPTSTTMPTSEDSGEVVIVMETV